MDIPMLPVAALALAIVIAGLIVAARSRERRLGARRHLLGQILDLADALERELLETRARLREIPALAASSLSASEQLSARATLAAEPQVQDALRDLLAHRLWIRQHAGAATHAELESARDALVASRGSLHQQLERLADVRADFVQARETVVGTRGDVVSR